MFQDAILITMSLPCWCFNYGHYVEMHLHQYLSRSPGHFSRVINPSCPYPCINERRHQSCRYSLFQVVPLKRSAHADNQNIAHKTYHESNSWHKRDHLLTKIELGVREYQCQMWDCEVQLPNLHKVHDISFQRCIFYQPA